MSPNSVTSLPVLLFVVPLGGASLPTTIHPRHLTRNYCIWSAGEGKEKLEMGLTGWIREKNERLPSLVLWKLGISYDCGRTVATMHVLDV